MSKLASTDVTGILPPACRSDVVDPEAKPRLLNRLNRIEGQVRGIARMLEQERSPVDVLTQTRAVQAALARVENELLKAHLQRLVRGAVEAEGPADRRRHAAELIVLLERAVR